MTVTASRAGSQWRLLALAISGIVLQPPVPAQAQQVDSPGNIDLRAVTSTLEREIQREMVEGQIPSLTIALVAEGRVVWTAGFGESNLWANTPATPSTVYATASTFKTVTAAALLMLMEEGHFELDDPVRDYLGDLSIRREDRRRPVTFRHLLTHTSGLPTVFTPVPIWADSLPLSMSEYLRENLVALGPPQQRVRYSNMGFTLIAHLVQEISGVPFQDFVRDNILLPLDMTSTDFSLTPEMEERTSVPYLVDHDTNRLVPAARVRIAEWPAGGAWGTVEDQGRWLAMILNGGVLEGTRVFSQETAELSWTLQFPDFTGSMAGGWGDGDAGYGLAWWLTERKGERYIAHSGSLQGYTAFLHGNVDQGLGVAMLTNSHRAHPHLVRLSLLATDLLASMTSP